LEQNLVPSISMLSNNNLSTLHQHRKIMNMLYIIKLAERL
jgi:hypothetical protein